MRKSMMTAAAILLTSAALPALAQEGQAFPSASVSEALAGATAPAAPAEFAQIEGLLYKGQSGGHDYWVVPGSDFLLSRNNEDKTLHIGMVFSEQGADISAAMSGTEPLNLENVIADFYGNRLPGSEAEPKTDAEPQATVDDLPALVPQPGIEEDDNRLLEAAPEEVRNELLAQLVEQLTPTTTRAEYEAVILRWREDVRKKLGGQPAPEIPANIVEQAGSAPSVVTLPVEESATPTEKTTSPTENAPASAPVEESVPAAENAPAPDQQDSLLTLPVEEDTAVADPSAEEAPAIPALSLDTLMPMSADANPAAIAAEAANFVALDMVSTQSRWFSLGAETSPVVYAVIDPACPYCSQALADLKDDIFGGDIQLRVIMAPLLSVKSEETIAGIMLAENPAATLFSNAEAHAGLGGTPVEARNATDLPADVRADLARNRQNVIDLGVSQIPYFVWQTDAGVQTAVGVPVEGQFDGALPEDAE